LLERAFGISYMAFGICALLFNPVIAASVAIRQSPFTIKHQILTTQYQATIIRTCQLPIANCYLLNGPAFDMG